MPCAQDKEEEEQCRRMQHIFEEYKLDGQFRWLVAQKNPVRNGELYRYIAGAPMSGWPGSKLQRQAGSCSACYS